MGNIILLFTGLRKDHVKESQDIWQEKNTNDFLIAAIESGSVDKLLNGGELLSAGGAVSESDREVIRRIL